MTLPLTKESIGTGVEFYDGVRPQHFQRRLALFQATVERLFEPAVAQEANRIAQSLQYGFFGQAGTPWIRCWRCEA